VNNPTIALRGRERPSIAKLFELEFSAHQRQWLDLARSQAPLWKENGQYSGAVRAATLHAYYDKQRDQWWFEAHLAVGLKPSPYVQPQHIVGVHVDPFQGVFVSVLNLDGSLHDQFHLDELRIAQLLENRNPEQQAKITPLERTAHERSHRLADALVALCKQYTAQLGFENIAYRWANGEQRKALPQYENSRTVFEHLAYKLPLEALPPPIDVKGVAPWRDCARCGVRYEKASVFEGIFICAQCGHREAQHVNAAREVARRTLWTLAAKQPSKPKKPTTKKTGVRKSEAV
jgi:hypothetical protein